MSKPKRNYGSIGFWGNNVFFAISIFLSWYISSNLSVNGFISKENALNILNALLDVDIALIAFFGLILVFHLNYITGTKDRVAREKHETSIEKDRFRLQHLIKSDDVGPTTVPVLQKVFSDMETKYANRIDELDKQFRSLLLQTAGVGIGAVFTIGFLFIDILLNVFYIGAVTSEGLHFMNLFWCLLVLLVTLYTIMTSLIFTHPKPEREILNQEVKKIWKDLSSRMKEEWHKSKQKRDKGDSRDQIVGIPSELLYLSQVIILRKTSENSQQL